MKLNKILSLFSILFIFSLLLVIPSVSATTYTLKQSQTSDVGSGYPIHETSWGSQAFTASSGYTIGIISINYNGAWINATVTPYLLTNGVSYVIVVGFVNSTHMKISLNGNDGTGLPNTTIYTSNTSLQTKDYQWYYGSGSGVGESTNAGVTWGGPYGAKGTYKIYSTDETPPQQSQTSDVGSGFNIDTSNFGSQPFTASSGYTLGIISINYGGTWQNVSVTPYTLTNGVTYQIVGGFTSSSTIKLSIRANSGAGTPTGSDLTYGTATAWHASGLQWYYGSGSGLCESTNAGVTWGGPWGAIGTYKLYSPNSQSISVTNIDNINIYNNSTGVHTTPTPTPTASPTPYRTPDTSKFVNGLTDIGTIWIYAIVGAIVMFLGLLFFKASWIIGTILIVIGLALQLYGYPNAITAVGFFIELPVFYYIISKFGMKGKGSK